MCKLVTEKGKAAAKREEIDQTLTQSLFTGQIIVSPLTMVRLNCFKGKAVWVEWSARGVTLPVKPSALLFTLESHN